MDLSTLPTKDGFRLRGCDMTRTETFTDAAFAFAVTMLVVSIDAIPGSFDELMQAVKGIPAFLASFALLMMFWGGHWRWSRRYGQEDFPTIALSCLLVFVVLCFVFFLKYLMSIFMHWVTGGAASPGLALDDPGELHKIFIVYGVGWIAMCGTLLALNLHAWRQRETLQLNEVELFITRVEVEQWLILIAVGVLSILSAIILPATPYTPAGWVYATLAIIMPVHGILGDRRRQKRFG